MTEWDWVAFTPRDTVFVRDGRGFDAAENMRAYPARPWPSTVAGALHAALGGKDAARVCGPVLARWVDDGAAAAWDACFPAPADLVVEAGHDPSAFAFRLGPADVSGVVTDLGAEVRTLLRVPPDAGDVEPLEGLLPRETLDGYLAGELPGPEGMPAAELLPVTDPLRPEPRIGLARDDRAVRQGMLYQMVHLRPEDSWAFLAGYVPAGDSGMPTGPVRFGGRGRLADVQPAAGPIWPRHTSPGPDGQVLVYVATPAIWPGGWYLPLPEGAELIAAATGQPQPVATTSPRRGWQANRALRWAVPAGSVYLLRFTDPGRAAEWSASVHGTAYGPASASDQQKYLSTAGFGVVLTGVWS